MSLIDNTSLERAKDDIRHAAENASIEEVRAVLKAKALAGDSACLIFWLRNYDHADRPELIHWVEGLHEKVMRLEKEALDRAQN